MKISKSKYNKLLSNIGTAIINGRNNALSSLHQHLLNTYGEIGQHIVEFEQQGNERAEHGSNLLTVLSKDLKAKHGMGYSKSNIYYMRPFYILYPKFQTSGILTWSHYSELLSISNNMARRFYENKCVLKNWSVREL